MPVTWTQRPIDAPSEDLMSAEDVSRLFGVSRDTLERWVAEGEFPSGLPLGKKSVVWDWQAIAFFRLKLSLASRLVSEKNSSAQRGQ